MVGWTEGKQWRWSWETDVQLGEQTQKCRAKITTRQRARQGMEAQPEDDLCRPGAWRAADEWKPAEDSDGLVRLGAGWTAVGEGVT
jgi:hypothetical protein